MRVTSVSLFAGESLAVQFDLRTSTAKSRYMVRSIFGIDVDEIIPIFYGFSIDGAKRFYDFKLKPREIVMRIVMNPRFNLNETYSDIRDTIYRAISSTRTGELELQFNSGPATISRIYGHIVKLEAAHFSNIPELQITIRCNDPMFRGLNPIAYEVADLPSINPVGIVDNLSTAPHGFQMVFTMTASIPTITIQDQATDPEWEFKVIPGSNFLIGDVIHFSSEFNNRYLYMVRASVVTHILDMIEPTSVWPIIFPGFNSFHFVDIASFDWTSFHFNTAFWGV